MRLSDGSWVVRWPRSPAVVGLTAPPVMVEAADEPTLRALAQGEGTKLPARLRAQWAAHLEEKKPAASSRVADHLRALDQRLCGWMPGLYRDHAPALARVEALHARRQWVDATGPARLSLPASTLMRALVFERLKARTVWLDDDPDGLSVVLGEPAKVTVRKSDGDLVAWLDRESGGRVEAAEQPAPAAFDLAVIYAGPPAHSAAALNRAINAVRPGGHIAWCIRPPHEEVAIDMVRAAGLGLHSYLREIDHWLLPTGHLIDGGGDLWIVERSAAAKAPPPAPEVSTQVRARPFYTLDIDTLDAKRLNDQSLTALADCLAAYAPRREDRRIINHEPPRDIMCWYDEAGFGLTVELQREHHHLTATIMPYEPALEVALLCAAYQTLADADTRTRPLRTRRFHEETVFG